MMSRLSSSFPNAQEFFSKILIRLLSNFHVKIFICCAAWGSIGTDQAIKLFGVKYAFSQIV